MGLDGKIAVVTGAGRGIGRSIALKLAEDGADIAIIYRKKPEPASEVKTEIEKEGKKCETYMCDVSDEASVKNTFSKISEDLGTVEILVNCAGLASWGNFIHDTTHLEWDKVMKANIYGPFNCIKEVLPGMRAQKNGHIINISSSITLMNPPIGGPYVVSKAGLEALTKTLAKEEMSNNIHVNAIAPGLVETDMGRKLVGVENMETLYSTLPFGRACQPEDLSNMVSFLVSGKADYIQGEVIYMNGGKIL